MSCSTELHLWAGLAGCLAGWLLIVLWYVLKPDPSSDVERRMREIVRKRQEEWDRLAMKEADPNRALVIHTMGPNVAAALDDLGETLDRIKREDKA